MRRSISYFSAVLFCVLAFGVTSLAAEPIDIPSEVKTETGAFVVVKAKTTGKIVRWVPLDSGLSVLPPGLLADTKTFVALANNKGRFRVLAYTAVDNEPSDPVVFVIIVGDGNNPPPNPNPNPPQPDNKSELGKRFQLAFDNSDNPQQRRKQLDDLIKVMKTIATETVNSPDITTNAELVRAVQTSVNSAIGTNLPKVREVIGSYLNTELPTTEMTFTPELRKKYADAYSVVFKALQEVTGN